MLKEIKKGGTMKQLFKKIFSVSYLDNEGARRICLVLGILLALIPTWFFVTNVYVSEDTTLREAVVFGSAKQQKLIFENYPYKCNFCELETNFERWKATFGSWKHTNDLLHTDCSKLREPGNCGSARRYLAQRVKVSYFDFSAFSFLVYAALLFYVPFLLACAVKWIMVGFKQGKPQKKKKK